MVNFIPSFEEFLNEKKNNITNESRINAPRNGFTLSYIESYLKKNKDIEFFANGLDLFIATYMHNNGKLDDADETSFFAIDSKGNRFEVKFDEIEYIKE